MHRTYSKHTIDCETAVQCPTTMTWVAKHGYTRNEKLKTLISQNTVDERQRWNVTIQCNECIRQKKVLTK